MADSTRIAHIWLTERSSITRASAVQLGAPEPKAFPTERARSLDPSAQGYTASQQMTLQALGDIDADGYVDGDGFEDFATISADDRTVRLIAGHPDRLTGDVPLANAPSIEGAAGVPFLASVGDLDDDGYDDFTIGEQQDDSIIVYLFYGGPAGTSQALHVDFAQASFQTTSLTSVHLLQNPG